MYAWVIRGDGNKNRFLVKASFNHRIHQKGERENRLGISVKKVSDILGLQNNFPLRKTQLSETMKKVLEKSIYLRWSIGRFFIGKSVRKTHSWPRVAFETDS